VQLLLSSLPDDDKKTVSIMLKENQLTDLNQISSVLEKILNRNFTRQYLIESAIDAYLNEIKTVLSEQYSIHDIYDESLFNDIPKNNYVDPGFDTIVVPAQQQGFDETFFNNEWYWVRLGKNRKKHLKFICCYVGAPTSAITHYAKIKEIQEINGKFKFIIGDAVELPHKIPLGNINSAHVRPNRYVKLKTLFNPQTRTYEDLL
jgi:hypothetical protein